MNEPESGQSMEEKKKPFEIKIRWVVIAVLGYMLIFNFLLYKDSREDDSPTTTESPD